MNGRDGQPIVTLIVMPAKGVLSTAEADAKLLTKQMT
jgi:hypothetical protein